MTERMRQRAVLLVGFAVLLAYPLVMSLIGKPFLVGLGTRMVIYALAAVSLDLLVGFGGLVSFGHAAFLGLGGYVVGVLAFQLGADTPLFGFITGTNQAWIAWPAAVIVSALAALVIGALSLRTDGVHFIMITLAFAQMLYFLAVSLKVYGGDDGLALRRRNLLPGLDPRDEATFYYVCLGCLVVFVALARRILAARFGVVLRGIKQNQRRVAALGIAPYPYKLAAFVLAGAGAGLAGALLGNQTRFVSPELLHWTKSGELLVMVILGGIGTLYGPILGAVALILLETVLGAWTEHWMVILGPILVLVVLFTRRGLYGLLTESRYGRPAKVGAGKHG